MLDPINMEVINSRLGEIVGTMQYVLFRTGYSTIIRESMDTSAAITDARGRLVGQATQHPLHMGIFTPTVAAVLAEYPLTAMRPGDSYIVNDPYVGGSPHVPDFIVATPVFAEGEVIAFCLSIAHKTDVGGIVPGSCSGSATEVFQEGLLLPVVRYVEDGLIRRDLERVVAQNSRTPDMVIGDLRGQVGCTIVGARRLEALIQEFGPATIRESFDALIAATARRLRAVLQNWPDGVSEMEGFLDHDGVDLNRPVRVALRVTKSSDRITFDFSGSDAQARGPVNVRPTLVRSVCHYAMVAMSDLSIPNNDGVTQVVEVVCPEGTLLNPRPGAPLNHYTSALGTVCNCVMTAMAAFQPDLAVAASGANMAMAIGGQRGRHGRPFVQYEILGSAYGGHAGGDGASATQPDMSNCKITPIEILESEFPVRVRRFELIVDSGGPGKHRGGAAFVREYELLDDVTFTLRSAGHRFPSWGILGGKPGRPGRCLINPGRTGQRELPSMTGGIALKAGDILRIERPGAGGFGPPAERPAAAVRSDLENGYVSAAATRTEYGREAVRV